MVFYLTHRRREGVGNQEFWNKLTLNPILIRAILILRRFCLKNKNM
ncbi:hypothetical protein GXM_00125 [Nostoc sphaeroides CCNUC1]|uniref:Uncharacterized protein n=1 Tax=Nostoc sphaeroides CCNUC1 TaxID=2653204 RepID=A0A5P8VQH0_9NOSO|nr:hypothetical protein GXM_00125 [Nostoc sphaeroides CCNUC1]